MRRLAAGGTQGTARPTGVLPKAGDIPAWAKDDLCDTCILFLPVQVS
jgi:hypothetical protein